MTEQIAKKITVVSGARRIGKSNYCASRIEQARRDGLQVAGILSPADFEDGEKTAFYTMNLASGEKRLTGTNKPGVNLGQTFSCWSIDPGVFVWANAFLRQIHCCDLLVIDELGPMEFRDHAGFSEAINCLRDAHYDQALVVIRPECVANFAELGFVFDIVEIS